MVNELAFVLCTVSPIEISYTVHFIIFELAFVEVTVRISFFAVTVAFACHPFSLIEYVDVAEY